MKRAVRLNPIMRALPLALIALLLGVPARAQPVPLRLTLAGFVAAYNALPGTPIGEQMNLEEQAHGIVFLPANEAQDVFVQLAIDNTDQVLFSGVMMPASEQPNFEGFLAVADHLMSVVFDELGADERSALLLGAMQGDQERAASQDGMTTIQNGCATLYYASDDNRRQIIIYKVE